MGRSLKGGALSAEIGLDANPEIRGRHVEVLVQQAAIAPSMFSGLIQTDRPAVTVDIDGST